MKRGFDTKKYLEIQKNEIQNRIRKFDRLYLEVGGHLTYDGHASRVLPGYDPKTKLKLLQVLSKIEKLEIIYCVNASDIESQKLLGDFNLDYTKQTIKDLKSFSKNKLKVTSVVVTRYKSSNEKIIKSFKKFLSKYIPKKNIIIHHEIPNYRKSPRYAIEGYKKNKYLKLKSRLIIITGAAGGSGKMATAMSQIYLDRKSKINSGFAKLETFPVWNLPLNNPINLAYEAATADLQDKNMIDPYHLKFHKIKAVNYNRDIENFSILMKLANKITNSKSAFGYHSPTDMGVGNTKSGITNLKLCEKSAIKEIKRRMKVYKNEFSKGRISKETIIRMKEILKEI